jgi:hypothetical protein
MAIDLSESTEHAGHSVLSLFVDDLDERFGSICLGSVFDSVPKPRRTVALAQRAQSNPGMIACSEEWGAIAEQNRCNEDEDLVQEFFVDALPSDVGPQNVDVRLCGQGFCGRDRIVQVVPENVFRISWRLIVVVSENDLWTVPLAFESALFVRALMGVVGVEGSVAHEYAPDLVDEVFDFV